MKKYFLYILTLITGLSFSQELEKSLLWKISGNGLKQDSYLYGTIHITCDATLDENTLKTLKATEQLFLELDMDDKSMQMQMMKYMMMKDGAKLSTLLKAEDFQLVDEFLIIFIVSFTKLAISLFCLAIFSLIFIFWKLLLKL